MAAGTVDPMRRVSWVSVGVGLLAIVAVGCSAVGDRVDDLRGVADDLRSSGSDPEIDFCLSLARMLTAVESGSFDTAADAAEETLAQAPDVLREDTRRVAEAMRTVRDEGADALTDPRIRSAVEQLTATARTVCVSG